MHVGNGQRAQKASSPPRKKDASLWGRGWTRSRAHNLRAVAVNALFGIVLSKVNISQFFVQSYRTPSRAFSILSKIERLRFLSIFWWQIVHVLELDRSADVESAWPVNLLPSNVAHRCLSGYSRDFGDQLVRFCSSALLVRIPYVQ